MRECVALWAVAGAAWSVHTRGVNEQARRVYCVGRATREHDVAAGTAKREVVSVKVVTSRYITRRTVRVSRGMVLAPPYLTTENTHKV